MVRLVAVRAAFMAGSLGSKKWSWSSLTVGSVKVKKGVLDRSFGLPQGFSNHDVGKGMWNRRRNASSWLERRGGGRELEPGAETGPCPNLCLEPDRPMLSILLARDDTT